MHRIIGRKTKGVVLVAMALFFGAVPTAASALATNQASSEQDMFSGAAAEFHVPENVLLALSYSESKWEGHAGQMSNDGGYGPTDLRTYVPTITSGRDGRQVSVPKKSADYYTLDQAAQLLHVDPTVLKTDNGQNIRGAAAVLAADAKQLNGGTLPSSENDWFAALAKFSGSSDAQDAQSFASDVYATVKSGVTGTTSAGQQLGMAADPGVQPSQGAFSALGLKSLSATNSPLAKDLPGQNAECPKSLDCRFIPAAYAQDDPNDPTNYGNYDPAHRPADLQIKYIFIHDTEGSYDSAISHFQDPTAYDSAQYVVRSSDGAITQMVPNEDVSWGVFDWYDNIHGINIENEGFAEQGAQWFTPVMYQKEATLIRWLAAKYHIPLDRQHILGHDNISVLKAATFPSQHWDPGPFWNWTYFMDLVQGKTPQQAAADTTGITASSSTSASAAAGAGSQSSSRSSRLLKKGDVVTISPNFATNILPLTDCQTGTCVTLPDQGSNFVYMRTGPSASAPLLSDPNVFPSGMAGTTRDDDWGDKAPTGFQYVVADVQGDWTAVWFAGQKAWFYNPHDSGQTATHSQSATITPKPGLSTVAVYGAAYPEDSAYPSAIPMQSFDQLYTISAGQAYATTGENLPTDYYYDATVNFSLPDDHMIVRGQQKYYQISINHRIGYVKADDVVINR